jgi:hypothetical protein
MRGVEDPAARALFLGHCQPGDRGTLERYGEKAAVAAITPLAVALLAVLDAVRDYLPPDGISASDCLSRVIGAVDNPAIRSLEDGAA